MPEKNPTEQPEPVEAPTAQSEPAVDAESGAPADDAEPEVPLNRAARRGRSAERQKPPPGHVGPQQLRGRSGNAPRSHTKRRSV